MSSRWLKLQSCIAHCMSACSERATLGITLVDSEAGEKILAHASLLDYPVPGSGAEPASWEVWARENFTEDIRASVTFLFHFFIHTLFLLLQPVNALFLHLFVAKEGFHQAAISEILRSVTHTTSNVACFLSPSLPPSLPPLPLPPPLSLPGLCLWLCLSCSM